MGGRPAKATDSSGKGSGPNGSEGDAQPSASERGNTGEQQQEQQPQQQDFDEVLQLRAAVERMESQVAALKVELNKEIEANSELRTEVSRRQQYDYIAFGAAVVAAIGAVIVFQRRR